ncbi:MAG: purine-nucleoside phosphorylase [Nitrospinae bacterium]|nr:purine-nucleoside phosphorylase [Nitrospinota bacterium]
MNKKGGIFYKAKRAAMFIRKKTGLNPHFGIILGSGLGNFAGNIEGGKSIPYGKIPHFLKTAVKGHSGRLVTGKLKGIPVAAMQGRFHYYEGHSMGEVAFPVMVFYQLGIKSLIVTNAAGGINPDFSTGDIMLIKDHINLMGANPILNLIQDGITDNFEPFVNMADAYDKGYIAISEEFALKSDIKLKKGVLAAISGPVYETPAEIEMLRRLGADAVCMSTVPEVIMARALNIRVLGVSLITNRAGETVSHNDVLKESDKNINKFSMFLAGIIEAMSNEQ